MHIWPDILAWVAGAEASLVMVPQIILMHRTKKSRGLSQGMLIIRQVSFTCLVAYVFIIGNYTLGISYAFSLIVNLYAWALKFTIIKMVKLIINAIYNV